MNALVSAKVPSFAALAPDAVVFAPPGMLEQLAEALEEGRHAVFIALVEEEAREGVGRAEAAGRVAASVVELGVGKTGRVEQRRPVLTARRWRWRFCLRSWTSSRGGGACI
jgi:hypothetical protein